MLAEPRAARRAVCVRRDLGAARGPGRAAPVARRRRDWRRRYRDLAARPRARGAGLVPVLAGAGRAPRAARDRSPRIRPVVGAGAARAPRPRRRSGAGRLRRSDRGLPRRRGRRRARAGAGAGRSFAGRSGCARAGAARAAAGTAIGADRCHGARAGDDRRGARLLSPAPGAPLALAGAAALRPPEPVAADPARPPGSPRSSSSSRRRPPRQGRRARRRHARSMRCARCRGPVLFIAGRASPRSPRRSCCSGGAARRRAAARAAWRRRRAPSCAPGRASSFRGATRRTWTPPPMRCRRCSISWPLARDAVKVTREEHRWKTA